MSINEKTIEDQQKGENKQKVEDQQKVEVQQKGEDQQKVKDQQMVEDQKKGEDQQKGEKQKSEEETDEEYEDNETDVEYEDAEIDVKEITFKNELDLLETSTHLFDLELFINLLEKLYPTLREDLFYCAPELINFKIKQLTGVDIQVVMEMYKKYHNDDDDFNCEACKKNLKRKFIESMYSECTKKSC